jgi:hypothetical protein
VGPKARSLSGYLNRGLSQGRYVKPEPVVKGTHMPLTFEHRVLKEHRTNFDHNWGSKKNKN